jgi:hypothetical protein
MLRNAHPAFYSVVGGVQALARALHPALKGEVFRANWIKSPDRPGNFWERS